MTNSIEIYQTDDGKLELNVALENETVWLSQAQMAELFGTKRPAITKHLSNINKAAELVEEDICSILEHMAACRTIDQRQHTGGASVARCRKLARPKRFDDSLG